MTKQNKGRKLFAVSASAALVASAIVPVAASASYNDESSIASWATESVNYVTEKGFMQGNNGNFDPQGTFTRAQAAVVAVKVLGLDTTKEFEPTFGDVKEGQWFFEEVSAAAEAEIIKGSNGNFRPNDKLTRQEAAVILTKIYGLDVEAADVTVLDQFSDKGSIAPYATKYLAALVEADVMKGSNGKLNPTGNIARQELAVMLAKSDQTLVDPLVKALEELGEAVEAVEAIGKVTVENKAKAQAAVDALNEAIAAVEAFELAPEDEDILGLIKEVKEIATKVQAEIDAVKEPAKELAVESVSAINAKQIEVKFNQEVEKTSAEDLTTTASSDTTGNYKYNNTLIDTTVATASLQADKKTVILTFASAQQATSATLEISGVKLASDTTKTLEKSTHVVSFNDTVAPTVSKVEFVGNDIKLTFSEPLAGKPSVIRVNNTPVTPAASLADNGTTLTLAASELPAIAASASATIYVAGAKDAANNDLVAYNSSITKPAADTTKPTISSITQIADDKLRVVFSEVLGSSAADLGKEELKLLVDGSLKPSTEATKNTTVDPTGKTYDVTFKGTDIYGSTLETKAVTVVLAAEAVADATGNKNDAYTQAFTFNKDKTGPSVVSAGVATNKETFEIVFNEEIASTGTPAKIIVTDSKGLRHTVETATQKGTSTDADKKTLVVDIISGSTAMTDGEYTITLQAGAIQDAQGNDNVAATKTVTVGTAASTTKPVATLDNSSTPNKFVVKFDKNVTKATALKLANYKLDNVTLDDTKADIYFSGDEKTVVIELLPGTVNLGAQAGTAAVLTVSNVADAAGNVVVNTNLDVKVADNTSAKLEKVEVLGNDIYLTFDEAIDATTAAAINDPTKLAADFEIKVGTSVLNLGTDDSTATGGTDAGATVALVPGNAKQVKITLTPVVIGTGDTVAGDSVASNWNPASTISVKVKGATLKDANGFLLKAGTAVTK